MRATPPAKLSRALPAVVVCLCVFFALACDGPDDLDRVTSDPACPPGIGRGVFDPGFLGPDDGRGDTAVRRLLRDPNFGASSAAAEDLRAGIVDDRLVGTLRAVTREHTICVDAFKTGHYFIEGVEDGPRIPEGYGEAGGLPNTHYLGRAADIRYVDGEPVEGNALSPAVLGVGRALREVPPRRRPDQIIGPESWTRQLGFGYEEGWILDQDQLDLHSDHIHLAYAKENGTRNVR